jgi:hypothetical protein
MKKLRAEIASVCEIDDVLSRKTLRKMFFLQRILKEGMCSPYDDKVFSCL